MRYLGALLVLAALAAAGPTKITRVAGVGWHDSLDPAKKEAAAVPRKRAARPIVYLRMLGELGGKT